MHVEEQHLQPDDAQALIPGLVIVKDFVMREEEEVILKALDELEWSTDLKRKVQQFGWRFDHLSQNMKGKRIGPLPTFCASVTARLYERRLFPFEVDQMIVNHYQPGQGIHPHIDKTHCFDTVVGSVGLGSSCVMEFRNADSSKNAAVIDVFFERRSAVVLSGDARYKWTHGIPGRAYDNWRGKEHKRKNRVSLTWRRVLPEAIPN